jgi:ribonuclease R
LGNDYYRYDDVKQCLVGERHSNSFRLGDRLQVKVAAVNLDDRKIDLVLPDTLVNVEKSPRKSTPAKKSDLSKKSKQRTPKPAKKVVKPKAKKRKK